MENRIMWEKGMRVLLVSNQGEATLDLKYEGRNRFKDMRTEKSIYFNETLFPYAEEGIVIFLDILDSHILQPYEILAIN